MLPDRFELLEPLGVGEHAPKLAKDRETGDECVIRELTLGRISDWKQLDLFERETKALQQLDHPGVPRFITSLKTGEDDGDPRFYLIQSYVDGTPLSERIGSMSADEVVDVLGSLLQVLQYLQSFSPPVLHRDITPDKVLVKPDGSVALVDFGSVQIELQGTSGGSTMVGTSGYLAPEQLMGRAVPASDVYSVGTTMVHVMTGIAPTEMPTTRMKLNWRSRANDFPDRLIQLIDRMIEPNPDARFSSAVEVLRTLGAGESLSVSRPGAMIRASRPERTDVVLQRTSRRLTLRKAAKANTPPHVLIFVVLLSMSVGALFWLIQDSVLFAVGAAALLMAIASVPIVADKVAARKMTGKLVLDVDRGYRITSPHNGAISAGPFRDVVGPDSGHGGDSGQLVLATTDDVLLFATGCTTAEKEWLLDEIADFIRENR